MDGLDDLQPKTEEYIHYYNNDRLQSKLKGMTPIEYRNHSYNAIYFLFVYLTNISSFWQPYIIGY